MSEDEQRDHDAALEAYLDGRSSGSERSAFAEALRHDTALRHTVELQNRVDDSLRRLFSTGAPAEKHVQQVASGLANAASRDASARLAVLLLARWLALAAAAVVGGVLFLLWPDGSTRPEPHFEPTPLAHLYQVAVRNGFEPYYECRDDARFAAVFANRQGVALRLVPMPEGTRMLGLSYPGGLSRDTTAMLCEVDEQPVMVFVDRLASDQPHAAEQHDDTRLLNVHRTVRDGLVFYEVSPFDEPRVVEYLVQ